MKKEKLGRKEIEEVAEDDSAEWMQNESEDDWDEEPGDEDGEPADE